jgi:hypothetical protein
MPRPIKEESLKNVACPFFSISSSSSSSSSGGESYTKMLEMLLGLYSEGNCYSRSFFITPSFQREKFFFTPSSSAV